MKNVLRTAFALAVVAAAIWLWQVLFPSPEKVITGQLEKLAQAVSERPGEGALPRMIGAQKAGSLCADNIAIDIDVPGFRQNIMLNREDLVQHVMAAHAAGGLTVSFPDINVTVAADQETAQAEVTVEARAPGAQDMMVQEMRFTLRKIAGKWLVTRVQTVRTFSSVKEKLKDNDECVRQNTSRRQRLTAI